MDKTITELEAFLQHKKDRRDAYSRDLAKCLEDDTEHGYERAQFNLRKANELQTVVWAIEHCIKIVKANERR